MASLASLAFLVLSSEAHNFKAKCSENIQQNENPEEEYSKLKEKRREVMENYYPR